MPYLVGHVDNKAIVDELYAKRHLNQEECQEVVNELNRYKQSRLLFSILSRKVLRAYDHFLEYLSQNINSYQLVYKVLTDTDTDKKISGGKCNSTRLVLSISYLADVHERPLDNTVMYAKNIDSQIEILSNCWNLLNLGIYMYTLMHWQHVI